VIRQGASGWEYRGIGCRQQSFALWIYSKIVMESLSANGAAQSLQDISEPCSSGDHFQYLVSGRA
jgi:hypothetical protein